MRTTPKHKAMDQVIRELRRGQRILVTAHPGPDGDAIGSMAAALLLLRSWGKKVTAFNPDPVPRRFRFLKGTEQFKTKIPKSSFDTTLVLDCSDQRLFESLGLSKRLGKLVVIDHHKTPATIGDIIFQDPNAASVGVLLYRLFKKIGHPLSLEIAEAIYCSIISDTGSFRYLNTNPEAMRVSAALLALGVNPWYVSSNLYEERPKNELELLAKVLETLVVAKDGWSAALTVTNEMLKSTGCTPDMVDGMINYARGIEGVEVAMLFRPQVHGVRVSLRSRGTVDVSKLAEEFGGGGHHNAAGFWIDCHQKLIEKKMFAAVSRLVSLTPRKKRPAKP